MKDIIMQDKKVFTAIGMMSGTSLDGVDVALLKTDGLTVFERGPNLFMPYEDDLKSQLRSCFGLRSDVDGRVLRAAAALTDVHVAAIAEFLKVHNLKGEDIDLIGFHGQTILHDPDNGFTWQIGEPDRLARETGIGVVADMRMDDVKAGGQGAPLVPVYHQALMQEHEKPVALLNIGGVSNITYIGTNDEDLMAFDTGPGNALIDKWVNENSDKNYDKDGALGLSGSVDHAVIEAWLQNDYFAQPVPKSLDVMKSWDTECAAIAEKKWSLEDGAATLACYTAKTAALAAGYYDAAPHAWYICGGGRHNKAIMNYLSAILPCEVRAVDDLALDGDFMEAEAFAFLAVRAYKGLALTYPQTTGVKEPVSGGVFYDCALSDVKAV